MADSRTSRLRSNSKIVILKFLSNEVSFLRVFSTFIVALVVHCSCVLSF